MAQEDLGDPGFRLWQTAGGDYSRGGSGVGATPRDRAGCGDAGKALFDQPRHDRSRARTGAQEICPPRPLRHQTRDAAQASNSDSHLRRVERSPAGVRGNRPGGARGGDANGDFCQTLNVTDVASGWTENAAVINKAQVWVFDALKDIRARLPFPLLGIDSDNGSEFINNHLLRYCRQEKITFTRGRAG